jgi:hypothetical protein
MQRHGGPISSLAGAQLQTAAVARRTDFTEVNRWRESYLRCD